MLEIVALILFAFLLILAVFKPFVGLCTFFIVSYIRPQDHILMLSNLEPAKWILIVTFVSFLFNMVRVGSVPCLTNLNILVLPNKDR